jgi:hypothetical protein
MTILALFMENRGRMVCFLAGRKVFMISNKVMKKSLGRTAHRKKQQQNQGDAFLYDRLKSHCGSAKLKKNLLAKQTTGRQVQAVPVLVLAFLGHGSHFRCVSHDQD